MTHVRPSLPPPRAPSLTVNTSIYLHCMSAVVVCCPRVSHLHVRLHWIHVRLTLVRGVRGITRLQSCIRYQLLQHGANRNQLMALPSHRHRYQHMPVALASLVLATRRVKRPFRCSVLSGASSKKRYTLVLRRS